MLQDFKIGRFGFNFTAAEDGYLPAFKGNTIRGGFGHVFRSTICRDMEQNCRECDSRNNCPYSYIFETSPSEDDQVFSDYSDVPRPFVIEPDDNQKREFRAGDSLQFGLILIGKAIEYFPYFIFCFDELGKRGLGSGKTRFRLEGVYGLDFDNDEYIPVYDPKSQTLRDNLPTISAGRLWSDNTGISDSGDKDKLTLKFQTPTCIKYRGKYISDPEFHVLIRNLLRRINMLMFFHGSSGQHPSYKDPEVEKHVNELIDDAKMVEVHNWDLDWQDWFSRTTRSNARMNLGGFVGQVTYIGDIAKFIPFIALGEQIHIGRNTTFGLGKYKVFQ